MAIMLWLTKTIVRPVLATFLVGYLCAAVVSYRYFFAAPVITEILIALCLGLALASARQVAGVDRRAVA